MLQLKNNFIFAPIKTGYSDKSGIISEKLIKFYEERSKYIGAITPEPVYIDKSLREIPTQIGIDNDDKIEGLKKLTNTIHQYNTKVNDRNDEYGGSFKNRIKLPLQILDAVKSVSNLRIIVRIRGDEMIPDGFHLDEMIPFAQLLEEHGMDALHITAGTVCSTPPWFFQHMFIPKGKTWEFAKKIKQEANIPTIYVGQINKKDDIKKFIDDFKADYIAIGRALVADPDFIGKYNKQISGNIRPCLACAEGCLGGVKSGQGLQCLVNPKVGKEIDVFGRSKKSKNFAVIGGGLSGMEAALTLNKRGHKVTLFEKDELGGQFKFAPLTQNKRSMGSLILYFANEIKDNNIKVIYKEAEKSDLINKYDEVIIVKRTTDFGEDMEMIAKLLSLKMMKEKGTVFSDHTHIKKVAGKTIYAEKDKKTFNLVILI